MSGPVDNKNDIALSLWPRVLLGAAGGLSPVIVRGATEGTRTFIEYCFPIPDYVAITSAILSSICLVLLGALVSFTQQKTRDYWTAFMLGVSAPALVSTGYAGASAALDHRGPAPTASHEPARSGSRNFLDGLFAIPPTLEKVSSPVNVANSSEEPFIYPICVPRRSDLERFALSFIGASTSTLDLWWLATSPLADKEKAIQLYRKYHDQALAADLNPRIFSTTQNSITEYIVSMDLNIRPGNVDGPLRKLSKEDSDAAKVFRTLTLRSLFVSLDIDPNSPLPICKFRHDDWD